MNTPPPGRRSSLLLGARWFALCCVGATLVTAKAANTTPGDEPTRFPAATQMMLWTGGARVQVGLAIEQALPTPAQQRMAGGVAPGELGMLVGVGITASERVQLTWHTPLSQPGPFMAASPQRQMRLGLAVSLRDPYADLRRGLLIRVEFSGQTALSLRPRGGRLGLLLTSQW